MKKRMTLLSFTALALLIGPGLVRNAGADIRVRATLKTPNVTIRVGNTPVSPYRSHVRGPFPIRHVHVRVTRHDRKIAQRLAWYTGVPAHDLVQLRRQGYRWVEIGRWLHLPGRVVSAARNGGSWNRFLREEQRCACRSDGRFDRGRIVHTGVCRR